MNSSSPSTEPGKMSRQRVWLIEFILIVSAILFSLGLVEIALRSVPSLIGMRVLSAMDPSARQKIAERLGLPTRKTVVEITPRMRTDHGPPIFLQRPNASLKQYNEKADIAAGAVRVVHVDANGFCNVPAKAERGTADVLVAGDSFTFCTSVHPADTAAAKLEDMSGIAVYNIGVGGIGPDTYLELLKKFAPQFQAKVAVMNVYEGNDLRDILVKQDFVKSGEDNRKKRRHPPAGWFEWSYSAQFIIANARLAYRRAERVLFRSNVNFRYSAPVNGAVVAMNVSNKDSDEVRHAIAIRDKQLSFDPFREALVEFVRWSKENNIVPIVTYIPSMYTVYEGSVKFQDPAVGAVVQAFSKAQRQWFADEAARDGFHYRDLTPAFQKAAAQGTLTHFPGNVHLTPPGHEIVARELLEVIRQVTPLH